MFVSSSNTAKILKCNEICSDWSYQCFGETCSWPWNWTPLIIDFVCLLYVLWKLNVYTTWHRWEKFHILCTFFQGNIQWQLAFITALLRNSIFSSYPIAPLNLSLKCQWKYLQTEVSIQSNIWAAEMFCKSHKFVEAKYRRSWSGKYGGGEEGKHDTKPKH